MTAEQAAEAREEARLDRLHWCDREYDTDPAED